MNCPICDKPVAMPDEAASTVGVFPFCSERCRLIDLGRWLGGKYQIPVTDPDAEESDMPMDTPIDPPIDPA